VQRVHSVVAPRQDSDTPAAKLVRVRIRQAVAAKAPPAVAGSPSIMPESEFDNSEQKVRT
jgi:hypothetical protein